MCHDSAVAPDRATGAPEQEIEITPEMIAIGVEAFLCNRGLEYETEDEVVSLILKATLGCRAKFV